MKDEEITDDDRCRAAGTLVARAFPEVDLALPSAARTRLQAAWLGQGRALARRRPLVASLVIAAALGAVALVALHAPPLRFDVQGGSIGPGGSIETGVGRPAALQFSDGTRVALGGASAARVAMRDARGAQVVVERGHARFDVVHRARARWRVAAGPFEIAVTGTSFDVDWSGAPRPTLVVDLHAGSVIVRGALAGEGLSLRAGQRLVADLDRGALSVVEPDAPPEEVPARAGEARPQRDDDRPHEAPSRAGDGPEASTPPAAPPRAADERGAPSRVRPGRASSVSLEPPEPPLVDDALVRPPTEPPRLATPSLAALGPSMPAPSHEPDSAPRAPALPPESKLAAGGSACLEVAPQIRFDRAIEGVELASAYALAFSRPALDRGRSWCGAGSLRVEARFDLAGAPNRFGDRPRHAGEVLVDLPAAVDLSGKTVTVHVFVEGPPDLRFGAQIFAVDSPPGHAGAVEPKWVGGGYTPDLRTGRWWTLSHRFERENRLFEGGSSPVDRVEHLAVQVYAIGKDRIWTGRVFVDDIGWQ